MQKIGDQLRFSASDLVGHLDCHHLTALRCRGCARLDAKPKIWDPVLQTLVERGLAHEREYVERLKESGISLSSRSPAAGSTRRRSIRPWRRCGRARTSSCRALSSKAPGAAGRTFCGGWKLRVRLGRWSYEVIDTKLARETKGATVLQLSLYSDLVAAVQGRHAGTHVCGHPGIGISSRSAIGRRSSARITGGSKKGLEQFLDGGISRDDVPGAQ